MRIRQAESDDLPTLQAIERDAGSQFADIGMADVAADDPLPLEVLAQYQAEGRAWVAIDDAGELVGYVIADLLDGSAHIEQVSVRPASSRRGVGTALIDQVARWAAGRGIGALTLTTFREVPWNGPYYERRGFRVLGDDDLTPGLRGKRSEEAARGLDRWPRVCMRRAL